MASKKSEREDIVTRIQRWIGEGADFCRDEHNRVEENNLYVAGRQWQEGDIARQLAKDRPAFDMNKVLPALNAIANREIMNRFVSKVYGRSKSDSAWAEVCNEFIRWQQDQSFTEHEESMGFRSAVASGYACMHKYWDPLADDGEGALIDEEIPIWHMLWDSRARKQNLEDRRWHICGKFVPRDEAEHAYSALGARQKRFFSKLDNYDEDLERSRASSTGSAWAWESVANGRWYNKAEEEVFIVEAEWVTVRDQYRAAVPTQLLDYAELIASPEFQVFILVDQETGELVDALGHSMLEELGEQAQALPLQPITGADFANLEPPMQEQIRDLMLAATENEIFETRKELQAWMDQYFDITSKEFTDFYEDPKRVVKYAVMIDDELLDHGERPQGFTYQFMTGWPKQTREKTTYFGFVDVAKGPQDWRNTFMALVLTRLAMSPKQTLLIEEGAVEDIDQFYNELANPRGAAVVPAGFLTGNRFTTLPPPTIPPLEIHLMQAADQGVNEMGGLSGVDLGQQSDLRRVSGTVVQSVKEASNTILAIFFDSLRRYRKNNAKLTLRCMKEFYEPDQVARIVGEEKAATLQTWDNWPEIARFDIKIDEAPTSISERMEFFDFLTRTGTLESWVQQGLIPPHKVFEWVPWMPDSDRQEIMEYQQQQQANQQAQGQLDQLIQQLSQVEDPQVQEIVQSFQQPPGAESTPAQ
jgi:hypothetical protein